MLRLADTRSDGILFALANHINREIVEQQQTVSHSPLACGLNAVIVGAMFTANIIVLAHGGNQLVLFSTLPVLSFSLQFQSFLFWSCPLLSSLYRLQDAVLSPAFLGPGQIRCFHAGFLQYLTAALTRNHHGL